MAPACILDRPFDPPWRGLRAVAVIHPRLDSIRRESTMDFDPTERQVYWRNRVRDFIEAHATYANIDA